MRKVDSRNSKLLGNLYREDQILQLKAELDSLQQKAITPSAPSAYASSSESTWFGSAWQAGKDMVNSLTTSEEEKAAEKRRKAEERCQEEARRQVQERMRQDALFQYSSHQRCMNELVQINAQEGLEALNGGNAEVVGSVSFFVSLIKKHLTAHLTAPTRNDIERFQSSMDTWFQSKLGNLTRSLNSGQDAPKAIQDLGGLVCTLHCHKVNCEVATMQF